MHIIDHISKLPSDAALAVIQTDGSIRFYMPSDELPLRLDLSSAAAGSGS